METRFNTQTFLSRFQGFAAQKAPHLLGGKRFDALKALVENQSNWANGRVDLDLTGGDIVVPDQIAMPIIGQVWPRLFATEICDVQPLKGPSGLLVYEKYNREKFTSYASAAAAAAATDLYVDDARGFFVGDSITITLDDASTITRTITAKTGKKLTINSGITAGRSVLYWGKVENNNTTSSVRAGEQDIPNKAKAELESRSVAAKRRILQASMSLSVMEDLRAMYGLDADNWILSKVAADIQREIDEAIIDTLNGFSGIAGTATWSQTPATGWDPDKWMETLVHACTDADTLIQKKRHRPSDYIIASYTDAARFAKLRQFVGSGLDVSQNGRIGVQTVGTVNSQWTLYASAYQPDNTLTLGIKGEGIAYMPYILMSLVPGQYDPNRDSVDRNVRTRDAIEETTADSFGKVSITS